MSFFPSLSSTSAFVQGLCPSFSTDSRLLFVSQEDGKHCQEDFRGVVKENGVSDVVCEAFEGKKVATF